MARTMVQPHVPDHSRSAEGVARAAARLPPAGARSLVSRVVQELGQAIVGELIAPLQTLPTEAELGRQFGVSRTVVREATRVLASKGLLETKSRLGTRVRSPEAWHRLDPAVLTWQSLATPPARFVEELFELRRMIEPQAAAFAAARITAAGLAGLRTAYQDMTAAGEDQPAFFAADSRFHRAILHSVGNALVLALAGAVEQALELSLRLSLPAPRGQQRSLPLHGAVIAAISGHDAEAARTAMLRLIDDAEEDVRHALTINAGPAAPRAVP